MARKSLKRYTLRYTIVAGFPSGALLLALAVLLAIPPELAALVLAMGGLTLASVLVGVTDTGIETASASAVGGFMAGSDAQKYQPAQIPIPDRLAIVCWLVGVGLVGIATIITFS